MAKAFGRPILVWIGLVAVACFSMVATNADWPSWTVTVAFGVWALGTGINDYVEWRRRPSFPRSH